MNWECAIPGKKSVMSFTLKGLTSHWCQIYLPNSLLFEVPILTVICAYIYRLLGKMDCTKSAWFLKMTTPLLLQNANLSPHFSIQTSIHQVESNGYLSDSFQLTFWHLISRHSLSIIVGWRKGLETCNYHQTDFAWNSRSPEWPQY
jgi:hypothetical protein